ncbi:pyrimidine utilization protein D [Rhizobium rhizogenes]|uniref:Putative carbamate hydrolase RutD n=1 Tax=Rhizobium rhizogenes (strain K84 / ATCC BAA-868) TaxID=311403 RepID=RUTD_RHIR8|nr:pyrimidine utilization protein D [Rhizobium rhizogenes]B9JLT6.1 RecName: Full=Putative carbamate hydrolase RutD; AltName: Full=Aminohydrolase [Rhizobium rhizogenes K84]OCJ19076.1 pyrimidine utilization protein D [Agrobacterium sp. B131/95]ACM28650.1 hydrolase protein [Rhizobium rhizogenes K84]MDJ1638696.1 pyrimidine utilization protein D [Rhizobium rhizogenes]NTG75666.1 pyrimidine utilization protein D [Rhizobium rhizogenes]NTG88425.1 pyrimidine utilization protein D [Rhizobium rhizogenes]
MHFEVHGLDRPDAKTIILSSGLGGSGSYWAPQIEALATDFRIVTYDHRGTGRTGGDVPDTGGISAMADDVLEIAARLQLDRFDFMGHALGGLIGLDIALRRPELIGKLILINAWSKADPHSGRCFDIRIELLERSGVEAFVKAQPLFLYPAVWMSENAERMAADERHGVAHFQGKANVLKRIAALRAFDIDDRLSEIRTPTLVVGTRDDLLVPYTRSVRLAEGLSAAELALSDFGAHAVNVVEPEEFNNKVLRFLRARSEVR